MNTFASNRIRFLTMSLLLAIGTFVYSDQLVVGGQVRYGVTVTGIQGKNVTVRGDASPRTNVSKVKLERFPIPQGTSGVVLQDGTRLSGALLDQDRNRLVFYATSVGKLEMPVSSVAGMFYEPANKWKSADAKPPALITRSGEVVSAKRILWADTESVAVLTDDGLRKFPVSSVSRVWWSRPASGTNVLLRNGDVLNTPIQFLGQAFTFTVAGRKARLPIHAASEINL